MGSLNGRVEVSSSLTSLSERQLLSVWHCGLCFISFSQSSPGSTWFRSLGFPQEGRAERNKAPTLVCLCKRS